MNEQSGSTWSDAPDDVDDEAPVVVVRRPKTDVVADGVSEVLPAPAERALVDRVETVPSRIDPDITVINDAAMVPVAASVASMSSAGAPVVSSDADREAAFEALAQRVDAGPKSDTWDSDDSGDDDPDAHGDVDDDPISLRKKRLEDDDRRQRNNAFRLLGASLVILLVLAVLVRRSSIESTLKTRVEAMLATESTTNASIKVEVVGRDVALSGSVVDESMRKKIISQVKDRPGVRDVDASKLVVGMLSVPGSTPPGSGSSDLSSESAPPTVAGSVETVVGANQGVSTSLPSTTSSPRLRPTVVEARIAGSVLTVKAMVSDANVKDILLKRPSENLTADELVNEVTIDPNDGQSDEDAHRRFGEFLEYLVKSGFNEANLRFDDGVLILEATVKTVDEGEQLRKQALRLVGDEAKLRPTIVVSALPASTSAASGETTTTVAATSTTLSPEALVEQQRLDSAVNGRTIAFDKESDKLSTEGRNIVDEVAGVILAMPDKTLRIEVGGHTDSKGSDGGNKRLSQRRATAVKNRLVLKGVPAARIEAVGFGEANPIADNNTEDGRAQNRRIEFKIVGQASAAPPAAA
jgi:outer membrane protein OmpA-like peptidoglycan-associated protein